MAIKRDQIDPPIFDWRAFLPKADATAAICRQPVLRDRADRPSKGVDLEPHIESLARLMADLAESYEAALADWRDRNGPEVAWHEWEAQQAERKARGLPDDLLNEPRPNDAPRPKRKLRANWSKDAPPGPAYDYNAFEKPLTSAEHAAEWEAWWKEQHGKGRGYPGANRMTNPPKEADRNELEPPPITPLHHVVIAVERWWRGHGLGRGFNPTFGRNPSNALDENYCNAPARLLWRVVWALNGDYTIENVTELKSTVDRIVRREKMKRGQ